MEEHPKFDVIKLLELLRKMKEVFDPNHYYCMEVKRRIIENIGIGAAWNTYSESQ